MPLKIEVIKKIALAKYLYQLSKSTFHPEQEISLYATVNILQDSVEAFLLGLADHLKIQVDRNIKFQTLIDKVQEKAPNKELVLSGKLTSLNGMRVNSKHYAIKPDKDEVQSHLVIIGEFFSENSEKILRHKFTKISLIDFLKDDEAKSFLLIAEDALERGKFFEALINCRKALFVKIEKNYDISEFENEKEKLSIFGPLTSAPFFARSKEYIKENVYSPEDYIVIDHADLDRKLITQGVSVREFWNVLRLTPKVHRKPKEDNWSISYDPMHFQEGLELEENAHYAFNTTINILLAIEINSRLTKTNLKIKFAHAILKIEESPIYKKADKNGEIAGVLPVGCKTITLGNYTTGLDGEVYYRVVRYQKPFLFGFIHNDEIERIEEGPADDFPSQD